MKINNQVFFLFLLLSIIPLFFFKYYISLDGPQHLYNANVLAEIIKGNHAIRDFFKINPVIVGYWSGHFFLVFFKLFLPSWIAEKVFIICYITAMGFSFRYLVNSINKENNILSVLIFPFAYSMYFMMGYYSFSISFIPFFLIFGFIIRNQKFGIKETVVLCFLFLFSFLSHAFVFLFTLMSVAIYMVAEFVFDRLAKKELTFKYFLRKSIFIILSSIPAIILWYFYIKFVMKINDTVIPTAYNLKELTNFIFRIRQLVAFDHENESVGNILIFNVLTILFTGILLKFSQLTKSERKNMLFSSQNIWFVIALFFLLLYYFLPDRISAGSLTNRIGLMFFYMLIIALSIQNLKGVIVKFSLVILFFSFTYLQVYRTKEHIKLNEIVEDIKTTEKYIAENSVLYSIRYSDNWFDLHYGCYVGTDKSIINLNSPQNQGQFPIIWNYKELPVLMFGDKRIMEFNPSHMSASMNKDTVRIDYILVYHKQKEIKFDEDTQSNLKNFYEHIYTSPKGYADLYSLMKK
jgi:hypothetical protein